MTTSTYGRPLSGAAGKDGPLTDQREKGCTGPTAKPGVAGAGTGRAGKSLDPGPRGVAGGNRTPRLSQNPA